MMLRPLGQCGLHVSALGFGATSLWGMPFYDEAEAHRVLRTGLEAGMIYVDTGPTYSRGNAEPRLGQISGTWHVPCACVPPTWRSAGATHSCRASPKGPRHDWP